MKTKIIKDNNGREVEVIVGLTIGRRLRCRQTQRSTSGVGLWSTELYDAFEVGKVYKVSSIGEWGSVEVPRVIDEDGCSCWLTPETFELV